MRTLSTAGSIALVGALLTAACGDAKSSLMPTAPSAVVATTLNDEATGAESGPTKGKPDNSGKPDDKGKDDDKGKPDDNGKPDDRGKDDKGKDQPTAPVGPQPPSNTSPGAPTNPVTGKVEIEGLIASITGTSITVNAQAVLVPATAVIRHGSRTVAFSELVVGDRVHVRAYWQDTALEATEVKLQNSGGGDDDDDDDENAGGSVWVALLDATASESGTDTGTFRLTRLGSATLPLTSPLTVTFTLTGTAVNGTDYTSVPLTATFLAGLATVDVVLTPTADALSEGSETVVLTLTTVAPYTLGSPTSGTVTIADSAPVVTVAAFDASASETGPDLGTFRFTRTGATTSSLTVTYTVAGTALNGTDYQAVPLTVTFPAGQATVDVFVVPLSDGTAEAAETVILTLTDGATYDLGAPATATATVTIAG